MKCSVIQDTDAPALHRARKDDGYSERGERDAGGGEVGWPPGGWVGTRVGAALRKGRRDVRFVRHRLPDQRGIVVLVRARVLRSKKYAHWHVN